MASSPSHTLILTAATIICFLSNLGFIETRVSIVRPSNGLATLITGQALHFQCELIDQPNAEFVWYRRKISEEGYGTILSPNDDDAVEIHNERMTISSARFDHTGDYICRALDDNKNQTNDVGEIKLRPMPYIEDFSLQALSHTGKSTVVDDGDRLELTCKVSDFMQSDMQIYWMRSRTPDDDSQMVRLVERDNLDTEPLFPTDPPIFMNSPTIMDKRTILVEQLNNYTKRLTIDSIKPEHRSYYACIADNGVTDKSRKVVFVRVKDKLVALWPFLGILAELFILFTIIYLWETQRAYKELQTVSKAQSEEGRHLRASG